MKILVTGGAGFIGSHLVDGLIDRGHTVVVVDSLIEGIIKNIQHRIDEGTCVFFKADIRDTEFMLNKLEPCDMIYHMAADPDVRLSVPNPMVSYDHNMNGTMNILEYMRKHSIKKLIFASSGGTVYGEAEKFPVTEDFLLLPISPYGASKAAAEMYLCAYANAYEMKMASVRYANIFGERSTHGVGFDFYRKLTKDPTSLEILGDGTQQKSYLHVSDCVDATILAGDHLENQKRAFEFYNAGSEDWYTVVELAKIYEDAMGLSNVKHTFTGGTKGWVGDVAKTLLSIEKLKALGYNPKITYAEGVKRYVKWIKENIDSLPKR